MQQEAKIQILNWVRHVKNEFFFKSNLKICYKQGIKFAVNFEWGVNGGVVGQMIKCQVWREKLNDRTGYARD